MAMTYYWYAARGRREHWALPQGPLNEQQSPPECAKQLAKQFVGEQPTDDLPLFRILTNPATTTTEASLRFVFTWHYQPVAPPERSRMLSIDEIRELKNKHRFYDELLMNLIRKYKASTEPRPLFFWRPL